MINQHPQLVTIHIWRYLYNLILICVRLSLTRGRLNGEGTLLYFRPPLGSRLIQEYSLLDCEGAAWVLKQYWIEVEKVTGSVRCLESWGHGTCTAVVF